MIPNGCSMSSGRAAATAWYTDPSSDARARTGHAMEPGSRTSRAQDAMRDEVMGRSGSASAGAGLLAVHARSRAARRIYGRLFLELISDDRVPPARKALLAGAARLPRRRPSTSARLHPAHRRPRRPRRRRARRRPVPRWRPARTCSTRSSYELGIDRARVRAGHGPGPAVDARPVRQAVRRLPELVGQRRRRDRRQPASGRGSRTWINKEESLA